MENGEQKGARKDERSIEQDPLNRYLFAHKGKSWDVVYAELCRSIDTRTVVGQHVIQHLKHMVHTHVIKEGKRFISCNGAKRRELTDNSWFRVPNFYVHPKSGVLMEVKLKRMERRPELRS